ncbi:MAG: GreA/GreB family elongation factor [Myxococcota bacterium]
MPAGVANHVTPEGAAAFRDRLAAAAHARAAAGADGLASARRAELDAEIRWLERRIATFVVTPPVAEPVRVGFGVTVRLEGPKGARQLRLVGVDEVDVARGDVSWRSPIAAALRGAAVGDVVTVDTPGGEEEWEVVELR